MELYRYKPSLLSSDDKSWRKRKDLVEIKRDNTEEPVYFSVSMARKYAVIYIFAMYFENRKEKAWIDSVLSLFGWTPSKDSRPYRIIVYKQLKSLYSDYGMNIELHRAKPEERCDKGLSYYVIKEIGLFNPTPLFKMLSLNKEVFERIIKEDFSQWLKNKNDDEDD